MKTHTKLYVLLLLAGLTPLSAYALDAMTFTGGKWHDRDDRFGYRLASRWHFENTLYNSSMMQVKGYWEASLGYWKTDQALLGENEEIWVLAGSPMFQLRANYRLFEHLIPYLEGGIGLAAMTDDTIGSQDLGSWYHFEDKIGFGFTNAGKESIDVAYRYFHYSNASIAAPNQGLDFHTLNFTFYFR